LTVDNINVDATIKKVQQLIAEEEHLSSALRATLEVMIMLIQIMANRLSLTSRNSSKPPSTDRFKDQDKENGDDENKGKKRKRGGQLGRIGTTLQKWTIPMKLKFWKSIKPLCLQGVIRKSAMKAAKCLILIFGVW
jgi:transposase